jgi:hypothetical protein
MGAANMRRSQGRRAVARVAITAAVVAVVTVVAAWGGTVAALADVIWT